MKKTYKLALCGIVSALSVGLMLCTGLFPFGTFLLPAVAGVLLVVVVIEYSTLWGVLTYAAVGILALITAPDREAAAVFVLFFGYYPVLKGQLERIKNRVAEWVVKYVVFNLALAGVVGLTILLTGWDQLSSEIPPVIAPYLLPVVVIGMLGAQLFFLLYDRAISNGIPWYLRKLRPRWIQRR